MAMMKIATAAQANTISNLSLRIGLNLIFIFTVVFGFLRSSTPVSAHSIFEVNPVTVNSKNLIEENSIPKPSKLPGADHILKESLTVNTEYEFKIDTKSVEETLVIKPENLNLEWYVNAGKVSTQPVFKHQFLDTGVYFLEYSILDEKEIVSIDTVMIVVGEPVSAGQIVFDGVKQEEGIYDVKRDANYTLSVNDADSANYVYAWDLGNGEVIEAASHTLDFSKFELPSYILLRKMDRATNVYVDSYIRVEGEGEPDFSVVTPAAPVPGAANNASKTEIAPIFLIIGAFVTSLVIGWGVMRLRATKARTLQSPDA